MTEPTIPTSKGRKYQSEKIDISKANNFEVIERDPGRVPSLPRPIYKKSKASMFDRIPMSDQKLKVEQTLAVAATKSIPVPPPNPKYVPHKEPEKEKVPSLSELI